MDIANGYFRSLLSLGSKYPKHNVKAALQLVIGAVFAGYTATQFPPEFLKLFERPLAQFMIFFLLLQISQ